VDGSYNLTVTVPTIACIHGARNVKKLPLITLTHASIQSVSVTEGAAKYEFASIAIVDSSLDHLGLPEFAGSTTRDPANNTDNHNHDCYGHDFNCFVEVRHEEAAAATEASRKGRKSPGESRQAPIGRYEGAEQVCAGEREGRGSPVVFALAN
jgi:hypothetical protein